jgi:hypothetical protein
MASSWTICLVTTSNNNNRKVVKVDPSTETVKDLFLKAGEAFGVPSSQIQSLKAGFPPQTLDSQDATLLSKSKSVSNQERVHVVLQEAASKSAATLKNSAKGRNATKPKKAAIDMKNHDDTSTKESTTHRPKRAAAQIATESFAQVIKQQDRLIKAEKQPQTKKNSAKGTSSTAANASTSSSNHQNKRTKKFTPDQPGRRLGDGAVIGSPRKAARIPTKNARKLPPADPQNYEDISAALLGGLNDSSTTGRIMRKGIKAAVHSAYDRTRAVARLSALQSRQPQKSVIIERADTKLKVQYHKGVQGRGYFEESVDYIPDDVLKGVIQAIYKSEPENLRPQLLALMSPRVLWSLAYLHWTLQQERQQQQQQQQESPWEPFSVEQVYQQLLPDCDWSFLRRRKQQLSAKAMENLRQQQEEKEEVSDGGELDLERGGAAIREVEHAMEHLQQYDRQQRAERVSRAAMSRLQQQQQKQASATEEGGSWAIVTPNEFDEDELKECIDSALLKDDTEVSAVIKGLVDWGSIRNWRELANQDPIKLHALIMEHNGTLNITEGQVAKWIIYARAQTIDEIIVEICDGNTSHVELLHEKARAATPKDLAVWSAMPDMLLEELGGEGTSQISLEDLVQYCDRARRALEQFGWLEFFITPIDA